jgi:hypothetical protein
MFAGVWVRLIGTLASLVGVLIFLFAMRSDAKSDENKAIEEANRAFKRNG